jgi:hypothetical protein
MENSQKINKIFSFFSNKWTKLGFSFVSIGYLIFLGWVSWITFAYHFVFDNAAVVFFVYTFINVIFSIAMIYTRRSMITKIAALFMHPFIIIMLIYGFGNWFLILPPFIIAFVIFLASGVNESLKVILGTVYMILFVLAFLAYITLESLTIPIPLKMDLNQREYPQIVEIEDKRGDGLPPPFRLVAYVDPETKENRRADFYIERTDLDRNLWNLTLERVSKTALHRINSRPYCEHVFSGDGKPSYKLKWTFSKTETWLDFGGHPIEVDKEGQRIVDDIDEEDVGMAVDGTAPATTTRRPPATTN